MIGGGLNSEDVGINRIELFGLQFYSGTFTKAVTILSDLAGRKERRLAFTPNVDHVVLIDSDPGFRIAYENADYVFADGMPIVWFSRLIGRPLLERVTGADLVPGLCGVASKTGSKIFLLGGAPDVTPEAADVLKKRYPALEIAGIETPPQNFENNEDSNRLIIKSINQASPDILFVALGAPRQELWAFQNRDRLDVGLIVGVGGAFDFLSGRLRRAPGWVQRSGFEWLWRLLHEPKRLWKRYLVRDLRFIGIMLREWRKQRFRRVRAA